MWIGSYEKDEFSLESFYKKMKNEAYTDEEGNSLVEDDL
jgi:hypothetical protein